MKTPHAWEMRTPTLVFPRLLTATVVKRGSGFLQINNMEEPSMRLITLARDEEDLEVRVS
ncbi:MAG: hypothetical protein MUD14_00690 [Hydrococcus sp. Prado102]|jgi:hypothetical protein|nr:hypothetical protein [Hydrococcus sp. Prado102]